MQKTMLVATVGLMTFVGSCLAGCGGGGGGGGDSTPAVSTYYKGTTSQTTITTANVQELSVDAIQGAQDATAIGVLGKFAAPAAANPPQLSATAKFLAEMILRISTPRTTAKTVASSISGTVNSWNGIGSYSYTGNGNQTTGAISGSIIFSAYQELQDSPIISGNVSFSGVVNTVTGDIATLSMTLLNVNVTVGILSNTLNGGMTISTSGGTTTLTMSTVRTNTTNNYTYWHKDFIFTISGNSMTISGTYYHHLHGYVVVTTILPLTVSEYSSTPSAGQLLFTGKNGTKARVTYTGTGYIIEIDANGNDTFIPVL
jgi:hypothetical protein